MTTKTRVITIKSTAQMLENYMPSFVRGTGSSYFGTVVLNDELVLRAAFKEKTGDDLDMVGFNVDQLIFIYDNYRDLLPADSDLVNVNGEWVVLSDLLNELDTKTKADNLFLNFDINNGLSINTFRNANAVYCEHNDVGDFLQDVQNDVSSSVSIDLTSALELLEGDTWQNSNVTSDSLEHLYRMLKEYQAMNEEA